MSVWLGEQNKPNTRMRGWPTAMTRKGVSEFTRIIASAAVLPFGSSNLLFPSPPAYED